MTVKVVKTYCLIFCMQIQKKYKKRFLELVRQVTRDI